MCTYVRTYAPPHHLFPSFVTVRSVMSVCDGFVREPRSYLPPLAKGINSTLRENENRSFDCVDLELEICLLHKALN